MLMNRLLAVWSLLLFVVLATAAPCRADEARGTTRGKDGNGWTYLVYAKPLSYSVGYGQLEWYRKGEDNITIGGKPFVMGLYAHATSSIKYKLSGKCSQFQACYGLRAGAGGAAVFVVMADGKEVFRSGEIYGYGPTYDLGIKTPIKLDVTGVEVLELKALGVRGGASAWSAWGDPKVR